MNRLEKDEDLNPMLPVVNLIDLLLVFIVNLLIIIIKNPLNPFNTNEVTLIKDPSKPTMEMIVKKGTKIERYQASGTNRQKKRT